MSVRSKIVVQVGPQRECVRGTLLIGPQGPAQVAVVRVSRARLASGQRAQIAVEITACVGAVGGVAAQIDGR